MHSEELLDRLKKEGCSLEIPDSVKPEQVRKRLEALSEKNGENGDTLGKGRKKRRIQSWRYQARAAAVFVCLVLGGVVALGQQGFFRRTWEPFTQVEDREITQGFLGAEDQKEHMVEALFAPAIEVPSATYEEIYASMEQSWQQYPLDKTNVRYEAERKEMLSLGGIEDLQRDNSLAMAEAADAVHGITNLRTAGVEEGDLIKNDGRYLYQVIQQEEAGENWQAVQILDTKDGVEELCRLGKFTNLQEIYVWENLLLTVEQNYYDHMEYLLGKSREVSCTDELWMDRGFHQISIYNLEKRSQPEKIKTFTLQGTYESSRIVDGYLYSFSRYQAQPGEGETDYDAYVPRIDGEMLPAKEILLPRDSRETGYLVLVSVDLENPREFVQTTAMVCGGDMFYVSGNSIYVTEPVDAEIQEGWNGTSTRITRFTYQKGHFVLQAREEIPGLLDDSFCLDEYKEHLRVVTTLRETCYEKVVDDRTGQTAGYKFLEEKQSNALYIYNGKLEMTGSIEGLALEERVYSARLLGDTGYFVTFRQTDPLFAVDLSDPENPRLLGELKVSGFSEYLHFYGEGCLLGIGMEADQETGRQECMKLSMFDISDPAHVTELARLKMEGYHYSEALYNYRAVLVDPEENLFGFSAEGSNRGSYWKNYLVFSYENGTFVEKLKVEDNEDAWRYGMRGTFIGDVFYLLRQDGSVRSYDRNTWQQLEHLEVSEGKKN